VITSTIVVTGCTTLTVVGLVGSVTTIWLLVVLISTVLVFNVIFTWDIMVLLFLYLN
jgi:hypothetical protein